MTDVMTTSVIAVPQSKTSTAETEATKCILKTKSISGWARSKATNADQTACQSPKSAPKATPKFLGEMWCMLFRELLIMNTLYSFYKLPLHSFGKHHEQH